MVRSHAHIRYANSAKVKVAGFEPAVSCVQGKRNTRLSHTKKVLLPNYTITSIFSVCTSTNISQLSLFQIVSQPFPLLSKTPIQYPSSQKINLPCLSVCRTSTVKNPLFLHRRSFWSSIITTNVIRFSCRSFIIFLFLHNAFHRLDEFCGGVFVHINT